MTYLPIFPDWNAMHPLIVHFPIALLLIAPLFVLLGAVLSLQKGRPFLESALVMMAIGTISLFVAAESGEAAGRMAGETSQIKQVLEHHEELAEATEVLFSALTVAFAALLFVPKLLRRELTRNFSVALLAAFLILYSTGALFLANTAHQGGRLVHELGVKAKITASSLPAQPQSGTPSLASAGHEE